MLIPRAWSLPLLFGCALAAPRVADDFHPHKYDWPQWQGPQRTAISQEKGLLKTWPKEGPRLAWKATGLGEGFVTPSIAAGRVFLMGNLDPRRIRHLPERRERQGTVEGRGRSGAQRWRRLSRSALDAYGGR